MASHDNRRQIRLRLQGDAPTVFRELVVMLEVEYADSLWVYHNENLNLWGHGDHREDALRDLNQNFAFLWREYAEEADDVLDESARTLKQRLLALRKDTATKAE
jgi:predicted HicB family RNase H-like nuclease